jgi:glycosyltransferase involved in cell wall biosynthesis
MNSVDLLSGPMVSIVLPTLNGEQYIGATIESILNQTYENFELIIVDDGSTDETASIIKQISDPRIQIVSQQNQGVCKATNRGFSMARGKYLVRHDHDDLSFPKRLERQVKFLEDHPECAFVGSWTQIWEGNQPTERVHRHPTEPAQVALAILFNSPFVHTACLYRKEIFDQTGGYTEDINRVPPEDYEYFSRISRKYVMANIPEVLVMYREVNNSMSSMLRSNQLDKKAKFVFNLSRISSENLAHYVGESSSHSAIQDFGALIHHGLVEPRKFIDMQLIKKYVHQAAHDIEIRIQASVGKKILRMYLALLDYEYHTYMGNTYHWSRLRYLFLNRPLHENFESINRLFKRVLFSRKS